MPVSGHQNVFGDFLSSIGAFNLGYDLSNLALISVEGDSFPALVQTYQVSRQERVQPVQCFNDVVHIYAFGRTPVTGNISGFALLNNNRLKKLIELYKESYRAYKSTAAPIAISTLYGETLKAIVTNFIYAANAERPVLVSFSMDFIGLDPGDTTLSGTGGG